MDNFIAEKKYSEGLNFLDSVETSLDYIIRQNSIQT
jgi:hypothetical protein